MLRRFTVAVLVLLCSAPADAQRLPRRQVGLASFYGPGFNGDRTANGELFDQRKLVAAHRTLPLGSTVRVTNLENGRQVVLRIIDRGPFGRNHRKGCIIDVSKAAARRLGFVRDGLSRVRVDVLELGASSSVQPGAERSEQRSASVVKRAWRGAGGFATQ
jgi:rare lipoprotein A